MAIDLATGFNIGSKDAIDERQVLTLEQMKNLDESIYPDKYFAICKDDGKLYLFNADNEINDETGKFREISGSDNIVDTDNIVTCYTSLYDLGLSTDTTIKSVIDALDEGETASIRSDVFTNHATMFPTEESGVLSIVKGNDDTYLYGTKVTWVSKSGLFATGILGSGTFDGWNIIGGKTTNKNLIFNNRFELDSYNLLAKIILPDSGVYRHNIRITCANKNNESYGWTFTKDIDICKFDLHFTNPYLTSSYVTNTTIKQFGLTLYEYPFPEGTDERIKKISENIRLYYDKTSYTIYVYLMNRGSDGLSIVGARLIGVTVENKGDIELVDCLKSSSFWEADWNHQYALEDIELEAPTIIKVGSDAGDDSTTTTYTSLTELGLTADATVEDVVNTLKNGESFLAPVNTFTNYETIFPNKVPNDQWNKIHIIKGTSLASSHIRCFSPSGSSEYLANINNTNIVAWNDVSGTYTDISDSIIEKLGTEILKYPVGKYRINSNATGNKFTDLPSDAESKSGLIEVNGTAVGKSPFTDTWVYRMYKFECLTGTSSYVRRLDSGATAGQIEHDTGWCKEGRETFTSLDALNLTADATIDDVIGALKDGETFIGDTANFTNYLTMFPNECNIDQYAEVKIERISNTRVILEWRQKEGKAYAVGGIDYQSKFNGWQITRFKRDGFADDSIVCIGDTVSSDGVIQTLATLGFSNDILTWDTGVYRVSHVSGLTNLPSDITNTSPSFRLEHHDIKKWGANHNPHTNTWAQRHSIIYCDNGSVYQRFYESGNTAGTYITDTGWQQIHTKKENDSYIPDMYDRNANGDMPVVPFDRLANQIAIRQNGGLVSATETEATYDEDYAGGYVFSGANDVLVKDKEIFNKIKVLVHIPGVLRIGIVNDKIYEANPRYSTCLVKWLVADFVAFTGMKEYDIEDTVLEEGQSIFLECRVGVSSWYLNTGEAKQVGAVTYPANSCTTGLNVADVLDTTTNNALFKSQKVNSSSCLTSFGNNMYSIGGKIRGNFGNRAYSSGALSKEHCENSEYFGGLNVGLYRRTKYSDTRLGKCVENAMSPTFPILSNSVRIWFSAEQEALEGKSVYAIKLDVHTPGNLTICHCKGTTVDDFQIIDKYTHYVRAKGLQTIHLPFDIKLNKGEYIGIGGFHCKSTADNIVVDTCRWHYVSLDEVNNCSWMNTIGKTGFYSVCIDPTQYPEVCTSVSAKNSGYINVELICRGEKKSPLEDKYISFTGDSITTYTGFCTTKTGYPEGNPAGDNAVYYPASGKVINNVDATWWGILARDNRMKILRNDAWSGSRVSSSEGSTDTKCLCGANRRYYLRNGYALATNSTYPYGRPEIIISMIGTNDLSGNVDLGQEMFRGITGAEEEYKTILSAFSLFCRRIHDQEGNGGTKIVHFLIPRGSDYGYANANGVTIADLSLQFERIAKAYGQYFIPLSYFNGIKPNAPKRWSCPTGSMFKNTSGTEFPSADGLHPNVMGMEVIADGVHRFLCNIM